MVELTSADSPPLLAVLRNRVGGFRVTRQRITKRLELLFQAVEALQRNDQLPIRSPAAHDEIGYPPDRFFESRDIIQKERRKHRQERAHIVCGFIRRHARPPLSASLGHIESSTRTTFQ